MTITKEVNILPLLLISALWPILPITIYRCKDMSVAFIQDRPSITGKNTLVIWFPCLGSVKFIKRTDCPQKISGIIHARSPCNSSNTFLGRWINHCKRHTQVFA